MDGQETRRESWKKFSVVLVGKTNGAHQDIVEKFRSIGHTEVSSPEDSDYLVVFCPFVSGVGTNICEALQKVPESWKKFSVILAGKTNGAHQDIVEKLRSIGHTEVSSPEDSDYVLLFCPVVSRVRADICEALQKVPGGKPIILVVMYHTFKPNKVIADSRGQVDNPNVRLTVDCLYYEDKLLESQQNLTAWSDVQRFFGVSDSQDSTEQTWKDLLKGSKPVILVVMHHTFNPNEIIADSRGQVEDTNVCLTVDCLYYEDKLLESQQNQTAWSDVRRFFGVSDSQDSTWQTNKDQSQESWKKFSVISVGKTNGAPKAVAKKLRSIGHTEASTPEDSDYVLVFCPVVSGVVTDIGKALQKTSGGKPVILVVIHHTSSPDQIIADSRGQVDNSNVCLTVDWLPPKRNNAALKSIETFFGVESSGRPSNIFQRVISSCLWSRWKVIFLASVCVAVTSVIIKAAFVLKEKNLSLT